MRHLGEEDLVLHLYGDDTSQERQRHAAHLSDCSSCSEALASLKEMLSVVAAGPVPERDADYGKQVWSRLRPRLDALSERGASSTEPHRSGFRRAFWLAAAAMLVLTFLAGRFSSRWLGPADPETSNVQVRERILVVAVSDHLDRSQVLLLELVNGGEDAPRQREVAQDLVRESRLYRQTAHQVGDVQVADSLEELERVLLDIAHGADNEASRIALREYIEDRGTLFKLRVLKTNLRERERDLAPQRF